MKKFKPIYQLTISITQNLLAIEQAKEKSLHLPLNPFVLSSLRETTKLLTTHYSTMIEGNTLTSKEVKEVITLNQHFPGRERDEHEVKGYYTAYNFIEECTSNKTILSEEIIQTIHALVMNNGSTKVKRTPYREGQNVIKDGKSKSIIYMPPEAQDVPLLMKQLVNWINNSQDIPAPLVAAIAHYQFATIHPYYDGNGRTARLLTTFILHQKGYDLKGIFSLEEYYAKHLQNYYKALTIGPSHNYYMGRETADITPWIIYFTKGMRYSFTKIIEHMETSHKFQQKDFTQTLRNLSLQQRKVLPLFKDYKNVTSKQIGEFLNLKIRSYNNLCKKWVEKGFLERVNQSKKSRTYALTKKYENLYNE